MRSLIALLLALWLAPAWAQVPMTGAGKGVPSSGSSIVTPVFADITTAPSTSSTNYSSWFGTGNGGLASSNSRVTPSPAAGNIGNLTVRFPTATGGGATYTINLLVNGSQAGSPGNVSCQITNAALTCSDTTNSASIVAGDQISYQIVPAGTPAVQANSIQISTTFTGSVANESLIGTGFGQSPSTSATNYTAFSGGASTFNATEANVAVTLPAAGTLDKLYVVAQSAPGAARTSAFSVCLNGTGSCATITCSLTGAGSGAGITTCNDTTHSISVAEGDTISLQSVPTGTPATDNITAALRFVPATTGQSIVLGTTLGVNVSQANPRYSVMGGQSTTSTEANDLSVAPVALTVKKFRAVQDAAPGGTATRTFVLRKGTGGGQSDQSLTCQITSAITSCSDGGNTVSASVGDLINWKETPANTPAALAYMRQSAVITVP